MPAGITETFIHTDLPVCLGPDKEERYPNYAGRTPCHTHVDTHRLIDTDRYSYTHTVRDTDLV